jgi:NAD(P)-dependent dehydrogenase (short-subunit alcohol dehydrogenase family)
VVLLARSGDEIGQIAADIGPQALALRCDVADAASLGAALDQALGWGGRLDVLINNAGVIDPIARLAEADAAEWGRAIDINLKGVFHGMRSAIPMMKAQGSGTIITVSSGAAHNPMEGWGAYCSAKAGAAMLTRIAHLEESAWGLRAMGLSPGTSASLILRCISPPTGRRGRCCGCAAPMPMAGLARKSRCATRASAPVSA